MGVIFEPQVYRLTTTGCSWYGTGPGGDQLAWRKWHSNIYTQSVLNAVLKNVSLSKGTHV